MSLVVFLDPSYSISHDPCPSSKRSDATELTMHCDDKQPHNDENLRSSAICDFPPRLDAAADGDAGLPNPFHGAGALLDAVAGQRAER